MANRERGEYDLKVWGQRLTLALDLNALAHLQDALSTDGVKLSMDKVFARLTGRDASDLITVFWATTRKFHPEITKEEAGTLPIGSLKDLATALNVLMQSAQPDEKDVDELSDGKSSRPTKARVVGRAGTGDGSRSKLAASA